MGNEWVFGSEVAVDKERERWVGGYRRHNEQVREWFEREGMEGRLLEVVIEEDGNWERICGFLDVECGEFVGKEFPRVNGREEWGNRDVWGVYGVWDAVLGAVERVLVGWFYSGRRGRWG